MSKVLYKGTKNALHSKAVSAYLLSCGVNLVQSTNHLFFCPNYPTTLTVLAL
jgi:predicted RNA-binding Zn-ribbon protein involved in translation (DUF1610 family)